MDAPFSESLGVSLWGFNRSRVMPSTEARAERTGATPKC